MSRVLGRQSTPKYRVSSLWVVVGAVLATLLCLGVIVSNHPIFLPQVATSPRPPSSVTSQSDEHTTKPTPSFLARAPVAPPRRRYAFAITITKDGFFMDGAAVLAYSIFKQARSADYQISLVAFIHPNVTIARPLLTKLGFHVIEVGASLWLWGVLLCCVLCVHLWHTAYI